MLHQHARALVRGLELLVCAAGHGCWRGCQNGSSLVSRGSGAGEAASMGLSWSRAGRAHSRGLLEAGYEMTRMHACPGMLTGAARRPAGAPIKTLIKVVSIMAFSGACAGLLVRAPRAALRVALSERDTRTRAPSSAKEHATRPLRGTKLALPASSGPCSHYSAVLQVVWCSRCLSRPRPSQQVPYL